MAAVFAVVIKRRRRLTENDGTAFRRIGGGNPQGLRKNVQNFRLIVGDNRVIKGDTECFEVQVEAAGYGSWRPGELRYRSTRHRDRHSNQEGVAVRSRAALVKPLDRERADVSTCLKG